MKPVDIETNAGFLRTQIMWIYKTNRSLMWTLKAKYRKN